MYDRNECYTFYCNAQVIFFKSCVSCNITLVKKIPHTRVPYHFLDISCQHKLNVLNVPKRFKFLALREREEN